MKANNFFFTPSERSGGRARKDLGVQCNKEVVASWKVLEIIVTYTILARGSALLVLLEDFPQVTQSDE